MPGIIGSIYSTQNATTTLYTTATNVLVANNARIAFSVQNLGTNPLYVLLGAGATTSSFSYILPACTAQDDGKGGSLAMESGVVYNGTISVAGTSPRCVTVEIAP